MKNRLGPRSLAAVAVTLSLTALAACGGGSGDSAEVVDGPWEDVVAAAEDEATVNLYTVAPPLQNDLIVKAFNEKYPDIKVNVTRGAGELPGRFQSEVKAKADGADVFIYSDPAFFDDISDDLLEVDGPSVEGWSDDFWAAEDKAIIPTKYPTTILMWNTKTFPEGFKTWDDLLESKVNGKLATRNDLTASMAGIFDWMEQELGSDYLAKFGKQKAKYYTSAVPMGQAVASGEAGVTNITVPSIAEDLKAQGAPVEYAVPEPAFGIMWGAGVPETSRRPNAARVLLDFLMSPEGQEAINGNGLGVAGREGVEGTLDGTNIDFFDSTKYTPEKMNEMQAKVDKYFP